MTETLWLWTGFFALVFILLGLDLGVFHRKSHEISIREAAGWSAFWISIALLFNLGVGLILGRKAGLQFLTGYLIEKALSVDNIFVFVLIFTWFKVPAKYQHRVLFWGIIGALLMRGAMIAAGSLLIERFHWILYIFGAFLVVIGIRLFFKKEEETIDLDANLAVRLLRRFIPVTSTWHDEKMFVHVDGSERSIVTGKPLRAGLAATPLFVVLLVVETTDLIFAVDSIPAIFAITTDPFIVFTSNVFAILGLRALYFLLAGVMDRFHYLRFGLGAILTFVGVKMLAEPLLHVPVEISLLIVGSILAIAVAASLAFPRPVELAPVTTNRPEGQDLEKAS